MNEKTVILHLRRNFDPGFGELAGADLVKEARRLRAEHPELPASAVLVHNGGAEPASVARVVHHAPGVEAPIALVAGRHSECDLGRIRGASLRHALILLWPPDEDRDLPYAEVLDLGTQTGIALPDGRLAMRVASRAPIRFGVASADVVVVHARAGEPLPLEPTTFAGLRQQVPDRADVTQHCSQPYTRHLDVSGAGGSQDEGSGDLEKSCVALPVRTARDHTFGSEHQMLTQVVRLGEGYPGARVCVRAKDLERGVRLGRYLRCRGASVLGRDDHVSRVHALVLERGGHRWLFDTASTNGTEVVDVDTGAVTGPVRGLRTFALLEGQAPSLAGQVAVLDVGVPDAPS